RRVIEAVGKHVRGSSDIEARPSAESAFAAEAVKAELRRAAETRKTHVREAQSALEAFGRGGSLETAAEALAVLNRLAPEEDEEIGAIHRYEAVAARVRVLVAPGETQLSDGWVSWATGLQGAPDWAGA